MAFDSTPTNFNNSPSSHDISSPRDSPYTCCSVIRLVSRIYQQPVYVPKTNNFITLAGLCLEDIVLTWKNTAAGINWKRKWSLMPLFLRFDLRLEANKDSECVKDHYDSGPKTDEWDDLECSDIHLFSSHFQKNRKALPTHLVRDAILPQTPPFCVLRDQNWRRFFCEYQFSRNNNEVCALTVGWLDFIKSNNLHETSVVTIGIRKGYPSVIHARVHYPPIAENNRGEKPKIMKQVK